ncbi:MULTISPECIES: aspartyl protease family protein [Pedobacter]|uniref:aspartyl protease family protein n=1 Tax=Pedobacter TaxID=84567 RepID=UPI00210A2BC0|nr:MULTISPECIES: aspartyl protease family protein [unclassified Pedobacter]
MGTITVPLNIIELEDSGFHLLVKITVFKKQFTAVVDTGASRSVFDKAFIESHLSDMNYVSTTQATTLFTTSDTVTAVIPQFRIGRLVISDYTAVALDLSSVNIAYESLGHNPIAAIIGSDILYRHQAVVNFRKLKLYLSHIAFDNELF